MSNFTNLCCRAGGSNLNAGTRTGNTTVPGTGYSLEYAGGTWVSATRVLTVASGDPVADGVAVGDFASVFTAGATETGFIGRVSARTSTTITIDGSAKIGTSPADGTRTLRIGGAWQGPNGTDGFPFDVSTSLADLTNAAGDPVRINLCNDQTYLMTAGITWTNNSNPSPPVQGFATAYGDLWNTTASKAQIKGPTTGASFILLTVNGGPGQQFIDIDFLNNGATGNAVGISASNLLLTRCSVRGMKGNGVTHSGSAAWLDSCEFDGNGGIGWNGGSDNLTCTRTRFTNNTNQGLVTAGGGVLVMFDCIVAKNGGHGVDSSSGKTQIHNTEFYDNATTGLLLSGGTGFIASIENSNFLNNGTYGLDVTTDAGSQVTLNNCGWGTGSEANASGNIGSTGTVIENGSVNYASGVTPWVDPANGDFTSNLAAAQGTGNGIFTQSGTYDGTLNYPNIGATEQAPTTPGGLIRGAGTQGGCSA